MHSAFDFVDPVTGDVTNFATYMENASSYGSFHVGTINGTGSDAPKPLMVSYKGKNLSGAALKDQLAKWATYGTIEPDAANTLSKLADGPVNLKGQHFVLIGAGSAMGKSHYSVPSRRMHNANVALTTVQDHSTSCSSTVPPWCASIFPVPWASAPPICGPGCSRLPRSPPDQSFFP